jgi:UDP-N-acetylmuramoyl-tripeptide--D-alanyl-D-alanine ligase
MTTIEEIYHLFIDNPTITTDSRQVQKGSIFFALKGDSFDGNKYALNAIQQGCIAAIVDDPNIKDNRCIYVENVLKTLQNLSYIHRKALGVKVLAITGTNGKTTTKELINTVLSQKYKVFATKGNLNNHIGVPLTLLSLTKDIDIAVVEMGANHPGEIQQLSSITEPDFGIITNIGKAHLEGFGSFEGVKQTKGELYQSISKNNGYVFYNPDNKILVELVSDYRLKNHSIPYGTGLESFKIDITPKSPFLCLNIKPKNNGSVISIESSLVGNYNYENILAAITVGLYMGIPVDQIKLAIESYKPSNSRSQLVKTNFNTVILDAYNANPSSMEVAIKNFASIDNPNKVVIVGEMLELGDYSAAEHKRIAELVKSIGFRSVIFIGEGFKEHSNDCLFFKDSDSCSNYLIENPISNAFILLKGSRGVRLEKVMERL